jgi:hypothetical protein
VIGPEMGKAAFRLAVFVVLGAAVLLLVVHPGTREFIVTVFTLVIGLVFVALVAILTRFTRH